jgi:predicted N-acetyltransferase YhbS
MAQDRKLNMRLATATDRARLIPMINAAFAIEKFLEGTRTDEERLAATMEEGEILIAEDSDGRLLASIYMERRGTHGYLGLLAVDPTMQGRGLGRTLIEAAESRFRAVGMEAVEILVLSPRTDLPPLYRKLGYEVTGTKAFKPSRAVKPGLSIDIHGIVMTKRLK